MELECTMDEQEFIVLDNGTGYLKVGFSGEDAPRAALPTLIATTAVDEAKDNEKPVAVDAVAQKKSQAFYGDEAAALSGQTDKATLTRPIVRGDIQLTSPSKEQLEQLWEHAFRNVLGVEQDELPVLIADPLPIGQNQYPSRQWMTEIMFEKFKVKSLAIFKTSVLSLFSTGRTRGLVVESGEGLTQAVPVFEGYAIPHAIFKMDIAGQDITSRVQKMMEKEDGANFAGNKYVMQSLKEKVCSIARDYHTAIKGADQCDEETKSFELPDNKIIKVNQQIRLGAPEVLFGNGDKSAQSVQKICSEAIGTCDMDLQQDLVRSLVVAGGTSMLPGLKPRLRAELASLLPSEMARQVDICVDSQRKYAAWIGGSMFASLSTFKDVAITKQEFADGRSDVRSLVARKTF